MNKQFNMNNTLNIVSVHQDSLVGHQGWAGGVNQKGILEWVIHDTICSIK